MCLTKRGVRNLRRQQRRKLTNQAIREVYNEYLVSDLTISELCTQHNISRDTFYRYKKLLEHNLLTFDQFLEINYEPKT